MARQYGIAAGNNLASSGMQVQNEAIGMMGQAAEQEQQRNSANAQIRAQNKAGNQQLMSSVGGAVGMMVGGPIGGLIGGVAGGLLGGLF